MRCGVLLAAKNSNDGYVPSIDHATGRVLAYVLAPHKDQALVKLVNLLKPFGIKRFFTDAWGAYERILDPDTHLIGKKNTQKIERKHLTLRTRIKRLARKTICYSKSIVMHDIVIGLFINRYEFCFHSSSCSQQM
jgi:insertion element IS1 protein InsB